MVWLAILVQTIVAKLIMRCESCVSPSHNVRWGQSRCLEGEGGGTCIAEPP
jgi:hypothetical protein